MSRSRPSDGMRGLPASDMPMIGHGFGLSWQKRWNDAASFSGRIARLPWTKPLATPAVVVAIPTRQVCRAATLGERSAPGERSAAPRSARLSILAVLVRLVMTGPALISSTGNGAYGYHNV